MQIWKTSFTMRNGQDPASVEEAGENACFLYFVIFVNGCLTEAEFNVIVKQTKEQYRRYFAVSDLPIGCSM